MNDINGEKSLLIWMKRNISKYQLYSTVSHFARQSSKQQNDENMYIYISQWTKNEIESIKRRKYKTRNNNETKVWWCKTIHSFGIMFYILSTKKAKKK